MKLRFLKKKLILFGLLLSIVTTTIFGAERYDCIVIHMKVGNKVLVPINKCPKIIIENQKFSVETEQYLISNISKYTFADYAKSIENTVVKKGLLFNQEGHVFVQVSNSESAISVYSVDGKILNADVRMRDNNVADIDLSNFPLGVYLLSIGGETIKIHKQ